MRVALFSRTKTPPPAVVAVVPDTEKPKGNTTPKKGKPTPKRATSEAARRTPIVATAAKRQPVTKEEKAALKKAEQVRREESYQGMKAGEERHLPARDKGAQRRYVRQYVDARRNMGEYFMPLALIFIVANFAVLQLEQTALALLLILALYAIVIITLLDAVVMWHKLKKLLLAKFGNVERGTMLYACMRAFQIRRMRIPQVTSAKHGNYPT